MGACECTSHMGSHRMQAWALCKRLGPSWCAVHRALTALCGVVQVLRRMVFASNRNLIQSEAVLAVRADSGALPGTQQPKKGPGKQKNVKRNGVAAQPQQSTPAAAAAAQPDQAAQPRVDHSQLPCEYHQAIVAGLSLASAPFCLCKLECLLDAFEGLCLSGSVATPLHLLAWRHSAWVLLICSLVAIAGSALEARTQGGARGAVLVVGLGGGGLPAFLATRCCLVTSNRCHGMPCCHSVALHSRHVQMQVRACSTDQPKGMQVLAECIPDARAHSTLCRLCAQLPPGGGGCGAGPCGCAAGAPALWAAGGQPLAGEALSGCCNHYGAGFPPFTAAPQRRPGAG
jgi:hypothetical protein